MTLEHIYISAKVFKEKHDKQYLYELYKREIIKLNLPSDEYETAIKTLCDILEY